MRDVVRIIVCEAKLLCYSVEIIENSDWLQQEEKDGLHTY